MNEPQDIGDSLREAQTGNPATERAVWRLSWRADPIGAAIADRHYNRQSVGSPQFVPPGKCLVLLTADDSALWVTSWPKAEFVKHAWPGAWVNSTFRRECGEALASDLIRAAVAHTLWKWPDPPTLGMVTMIDPDEVQGTKVRGEVVYGYSYLKAGFKLVGTTKDRGLLVFQMVPEDMPEAAAPMPRAGQLVAS